MCLDYIFISSVTLLSLRQSSFSISLVIMITMSHGYITPGRRHVIINIWFITMLYSRLTRVTKKDIGKMVLTNFYFFCDLSHRVEVNKDSIHIWLCREDTEILSENSTSRSCFFLTCRKESKSHRRHSHYSMILWKLVQRGRWAKATGTHALVLTSVWSCITEKFSGPIEEFFKVSTTPLLCWGLS